MEHLVWDSLYSVGIKGMDRQHQKLIEIINLFLELENQVLTRQKLLSVLNNLIKYTQFHFDDEEKLMSHYNYPKLAAHKQQHDALLDEVFQLRELLDAEGILKITPRIKQFMETWLFEHIVHHDKAYGEFINQMQSK